MPLRSSPRAIGIGSRSSSRNATRGCRSTRSHSCGGAAAVMATDLAPQPMAGIPVQAGGDSHLMNFGAFVTPENNILFDVNDFDESLPDVDFTVDLKRLAASVAVAALGSGAPKKQARALAAATVKAYRSHMAALAKLSPLEIWHSRIDLEHEIDQIGNASLRRKLAGVIAKARGEGLSKDDNFPHLVSGGVAARLHRNSGHRLGGEVCRHDGGGARLSDIRA